MHPSAQIFKSVRLSSGFHHFFLTYAAFFCCSNFAHLARWAAAIFLLDAAETCRLDRRRALPFEPLFAHRAFCARLIFLRADADIFRRLPADLFDFELNPDNAETAASSRPNSNAALSRAAFNCASMSMYSPSGWDCSKMGMYF